MKLRAVILVSICGAVALASQAGVKLERKYKKGERDNYAMTLKLDNSGVPVTIETTVTQEVKNVYENGDADVEMSVGTMRMRFNKQEMTQAGDRPSTVRLTKTGLPALGNSLKGLQSMMVYGASFADREVKVGETAPIEYSDPANPATRLKGTAKLESLEKGVAKVTSKFDVLQPNAQMPMHIESTALIEVSTAKPNRIEGVVSGGKLAGTDTSRIDSAQFIFERKK